jgi:hypothetical protein
MPDQSITEGKGLRVAFDATNRGDAADTQDILLEIDGTEEDKIPGVELAPGETYSGDLLWLTESGDAQSQDYTAAVVTDDRDASITVNVS